MASFTQTTLSPIPVYLAETVARGALAPRPASLDGKVLGLIPNWRPAAVQLLKAVGELLEKRYRLKAVVMELPPIDSNFKGMPEKLDDFAKRVDVAITASGD